jgi:hypothetical protein
MLPKLNTKELKEKYIETMKFILNKYGEAYDEADNPVGKKLFSIILSSCNETLEILEQPDLRDDELLVTECFSFILSTMASILNEGNNKDLMELVSTATDYHKRMGRG